jgi:hypothetical protein
MNLVGKLIADGFKGIFKFVESILDHLPPGILKVKGKNPKGERFCHMRIMPKETT